MTTYSLLSRNAQHAFGPAISILVVEAAKSLSAKIAPGECGWLVEAPR
jgi:hypothetical protein